MTVGRRQVIRLYLLALVGALALLLAWRLTRFDWAGRLALNALGLRLLYSQADAQNPARLQAELAHAAARDCHVFWLLGMLSLELGQTPVQEAAWRQALDCSPVYAVWLWMLFPERGDLAELARQKHPSLAEVWLWLGDTNLKSDPEAAARYYWRGLQTMNYKYLDKWLAFSEAIGKLDKETALRLYDELGIEATGRRNLVARSEALFTLGKILYADSPEQGLELYRQGLSLRPHAELRWREYGDMIRPYDPEQAIQAYLKVCFMQDLGNHGCYRAGLTAESIGRYQDAIRYYRYSDWSGALERAAELERRWLYPAR